MYYWKVNSTISSKGSSGLIENHAVLLSGLTASTTYFYNVTSCDAAGNCNSSVTPFNFTTSAVVGGGGGGGGGSGNGGPKCNSEDWSCSWAPAGCVDGSIDYVCVNKCDDTKTTAVTCASNDNEETNAGGEPAENPTETGKRGITGAVIGFAQKGVGKLTLGIIIFLALGWMFLAYRRKKDKKKGKK